MIIRSLRVGDIDSVIAMAFNEGWVSEAREFEMHRRLRGALAVVLAEDNEVIGCVTVFTHRRSAWIGNLLVRPDRRGQGFGVSLIRHALDWMENRRVETLLLAADSRAVSMYRRLGFKPLTQIYRWRREPNDRLILNDYIGGMHSSRRIAILDAACWDDDRSKLLKLIGWERDCVVLPEKDGFLFYGQVGDLWTLGPGAVSRRDEVRMEHLVNRVLARVGGGCPIALDAFPANRPLSKILEAGGFAIVSSTLLMYKGRVPDIKFQNLLATASLGSMG